MDRINSINAETKRMKAIESGKSTITAQDIVLDYTPKNIHSQIY
jgi:hypothetical protein